jgi:hypothetical protein
VKQLPPPDTSPIELASILEVADLPGWLQDVARRSERREVDMVPVPVGEPELESPANRGSDVLVDAEDSVPALERQPGFPEEPAGLQPDSGEGELTAGPSAEDDVEAQVAADDVEVERPVLDVAESAPVAPEDDAVTSTGGIGGHRATARREPVDWAAVRQEAESSEQEPPAATNPLLAQNPPVRVDPTTARRRSSHSRNAQDRPWWMSDAAIGVLLLAVILTMIYVILVASGVL